MSNRSQSKIPSPARSQGFRTPRRHTRRTLSSASPAQSEGPLSTMVEKFVKSDKFVLSPMQRRSVLPDNTDIEAPRRASWWKRLEGSTRDVLEALDTNKMTDNFMLEEYEFEVEKADKQSQSVQHSQSSDSESVASIVVPQRRLFNRKQQTQAEFGDIMGTRKSLGKTNIEDQSIEVAPKNLFNKGPRNRPVFPAALLNSTNKTINKTVEPETNKQTRPNLFSRAGTKRKNMFTDFVVSDSEEDSEVQHKIFGFKKDNNKKLSLGTRNTRMPSLTPSMTTEIDIDDWNLLPSSTMIGAQSSAMSDNDMELQDENKDDTLTENLCLNRSNKQAHTSVIDDDENDKTLTNENITEANKNQDAEVKNVSRKVNKTREKSKTKLNTSDKDKSLQNKSTKQAVNILNAENVQIEEVTAMQQQENAVADKNTRLAKNEQSLEHKMAELHGESVETEKSQPNIVSNKTQENPDIHEEACKTNEDKSEKQEQSEVEPEQSEEEPGQSEEQQEQREEEQEQSKEQHEQTEKEQEPSLEEQETQNQTDEANKYQYEDMVEKDKSEEEMSQEDQDEDMEEMIWKHNEDEHLSDAVEKEVATVAEQNNEVMPNEKNTDISKKLSKVKQNADKSNNISNKCYKIVDASVDNDQNEEDIVEETPNNSTHDTTSRNRKKQFSTVNSLEAVLHNLTNDNESFRPIGRSTTFRKSKSVYETMNMRHSLAPVQESTLGSEGSRNSSTEGSEWDSHRVTRKTIRQTLGKEYTTRKSLRALIMEQSAKRQTQLYNKTMTKFDKTKSKTVAADGNDKNASKMNKSKNKTVVQDANNKNASTVNRTKNKTVDVNTDKCDNVSKDKTKNKTVLDDNDDQHFRDRRSSNCNITSNESPILKSPVHETSIHDVPDPLIHKSLGDIMEPEPDIADYLATAEESVNIPIPDNNDSGPEISMNASYGQGMSVSGHEIVEETSGKGISLRGTSMRSNSNHLSEEVLDYEASEQVISGLEDRLNESGFMQHEKESKPENEEEMEQSEQEIEYDQEDSEDEQEQSQQEIESEHDQSQQEIESDQEKSQPEIEDERDQSQQEIESDQEEFQQDIEDEQDQSQQENESDQEESQQEIEDERDQSQQEIESDQEEFQQDIEDDQDQSQQEIESDQEESQQEVEDAEQSQQEIESEQELESEEEQQSENEDHDMSQEPESGSKPENHDHDDDFISALNYEYKTQEKRGVSRIVFDSNMEFDDEIDFEGVSRQTDNDITEREPELSRASLQTVSEPRVHDVSVGTKKAMLLMQMQKIAQENMKQRQKIREEVQKSLKPTRKFNLMSPIQAQRSIRREPRPEPRKPKQKPPTGIHTKALPRAFVEDLMYKPPKRFQPANAPWITKRLYKFLETKLEPKYDYRARVRAEELVQTLFNFTKLVRRRPQAPQEAIDQLKTEMARLRIVDTHYEFYDFFHEFMPREVRIKVNPALGNKIPAPPNVFADILPSRTVVE